MHLIYIKINLLVDGSYFSTHYHLGHRKFETGEPELFLFGELKDINFLNSKPVSVSEGGRERERERERGAKTYIRGRTHHSFPTSSLAETNPSDVYEASSTSTVIQ